MDIHATLLLAIGTTVMLLVMAGLAALVVAGFRASTPEKSRFALRALPHCVVAARGLLLLAVLLVSASTSPEALEVVVELFETPATP